MKQKLRINYHNAVKAEKLHKAKCDRLREVYEVELRTAPTVQERKNKLEEEFQDKIRTHINLDLPLAERVELFDKLRAQYDKKINKITGLLVTRAALKAYKAWEDATWSHSTEVTRNTRIAHKLLSAYMMDIELSLSKLEPHEIEALGV